MSDNMLNRSGWTEVSCEESERVRDEGVFAISSLTDYEGQFGRPVYYTEWASSEDHDRPVLRDYLWEPRSSTGAKCEHLVPERESAGPES